MFAAANSSLISVYNFYTGECPSYMQFKGHVGKVRGIDWFEDDTGFASCSTNGDVFFYDLQLYKET
jgi:WD40 repeat protein